MEALEDGADLDRLRGEALRTKLRPVYAALEELRRCLPAETALIGFAGAPWTVATYMLEGGSSRDFAVAKHWMAERPDDFARLMDLLVGATLDRNGLRPARSTSI